MRDDQWDRLAERPRPSWYLDPLVAEQKRRLYQDLVRKWTEGFSVHTVLKTDLFEESYGEDQILFDLFPRPYAAIGIDLAPLTVRHAKDRCPLPDARFLVTDVRSLSLRPGVADLIVSNSTLDHFDSQSQFVAALEELVRVLRPGGLLIVTVDNPLNPLYRVLRLLCRLRCGPFSLGYTTSLDKLAKRLEEMGLEIMATGGLIHNPRLISTILFLALRRLLGRRADTAIGALLRLFASLERLPTRRFSACFVGACARKPAKQSDPPPSHAGTEVDPQNTHFAPIWIWRDVVLVSVIRPAVPNRWRLLLNRAKPEGI